VWEEKLTERKGVQNRLIILKENERMSGQEGICAKVERLAGSFSKKGGFFRSRLFCMSDG